MCLSSMTRTRPKNYVSKLWSLRVERTNPAQATLHTALQGVIKPLLAPLDFARLSGKSNSPTDLEWVDKIPTSKFIEIANDVAEVIEAHAQDTELTYPWSMIREHLHACHLYLSSQDILIRPLIPPTWSHGPFNDPNQRLYMSATLGAGGDLERLMGRPSIHRLSIPEGWDRQGVGRRFFIFPGMSLDVEATAELRLGLMRRAKRSLVLVPSGRMCDEIAKDVEDNLGFPIVKAQDIEGSKEPFISATEAVAVVANRYDGIDFPHAECRLLFIEGLPKATNLQERFIMTRMGANVLFNERVQVRVLQAIGRCTRSLEDYSAVVVSGEEMTNYLADVRRRKFLHPELQAEISFGAEQSKDVSREDFLENFVVFLENGKAWEEVNQQIVTARENTTQEPFPAIKELDNVVKHEINFQKNLWQGDYEAALDCAERVLGGLNAEVLRGYRALWHYLAGSASRLGADTDISSLATKARTHFSKAKEAAIGIPWLVKLVHYQPEEASSNEENFILMEQIERVEALLTKLGTVHDQRFARREKEILDGLQSKKSGPFEQAHKLLGEILGFEAGNIKEDGAPDPWWIAGNVCFVFEDHAGAQETSAIDVTKARQVSTHPDWMRENIQASAQADILPVLITPVKKVKKGAAPHLKEVALWPLDEFRSWAGGAIAVIRELRTTFIEPGNLHWREIAAEKFKQGALDAVGLSKKTEVSGC